MKLLDLEAVPLDTLLDAHMALDVVDELDRRANEIPEH